LLAKFKAVIASIVGVPGVGKDKLSMDTISKEKRALVMSRIGSKNTKPEILLRSELFKKGLRYRVHVKKLPGRPDIVFTKYKLAIFIHGCFWHLHQDCREGRLPKTNLDYWKPKLLKNVQRDKDHEQELKNMGWAVIAFWECEIETDIHEVIRCLLEHLIKQ
jgi:DNA mismatch endonuclease, patch repair protein